MKFDTIRPMAERKYANIPIQEIKVLNSRKRDRSDFEHNIRSINEVGLRKPIVVNERYRKQSGYYDLVCGEGRFLAYKELNHTEIQAEVINCDRKQALLFSLVENIARVTPGTMWFAYEVKRLHDSGFSYEKIGKIAGYTETYIRDFVRLVEQGEERLIKGVEEGLFPMGFAIQVSQSDSATVQNLLMDAFDNRIINCSNVATVRKIIMSRLTRRSIPLRSKGSGTPIPVTPSLYTMDQLKSDISAATKEKEAFVKEASFRENRLLMLLEGLKSLWADSGLAGLLMKEGIGPIPLLTGEYHV
jgi:ParB family chromosome partitioning protein